MGEEWWAKGTNIYEGPGINVLRAPKNGRTFEYISGVRCAFFTMDSAV
jgi:beta-glucosidase